MHYQQKMKHQIKNLKLSTAQRRVEELPITTKDLQSSPFRLQTYIRDKMYNPKKKKRAITISQTMPEMSTENPITNWTK